MTLYRVVEAAWAVSTIPAAFLFWWCWAPFSQKAIEAPTGWRFAGWSALWVLVLCLLMGYIIGGANYFDLH